jgi:hypothetical protein
MNGNDLTAEARRRGWQTAYLFNLELHPDAEIAWEANQWRQLNAPGIANLCDALLQERRDQDFLIPGNCSPEELAALWGRVSQPQVFRLVRSGAVCLVAGMRLTYWLETSAEDLPA